MYLNGYFGSFSRSDVPYLKHQDAIDEVLLMGIEVEKQLVMLQERLQEESEKISGKCIFRL